MQEGLVFLFRLPAFEHRHVVLGLRPARSGECEQDPEPILVETFDVEGE